MNIRAKIEPVTVGEKQIAFRGLTSHENIPILCFAITASIQTELLQAYRLYNELVRKHAMVTGLQFTPGFRVIWGTPCLAVENNEDDEWDSIPLDYEVLPITMATTHYVASCDGIEFFGEHKDVLTGYVCTRVLPWSTIEDADL